MAEIHGKEAFFKLGTEDITEYITDVGLDRTKDAEDTTTLGKDSKTYIPGLKDGTVPISGNLTPDLDAELHNAYENDTPIAFEYGPAGDGSGKIKYSGTVIVTTYNISSPQGKATTSATLQITGDVTRGTFT